MDKSHRSRALLRLSACCLAVVCASAAAQTTAVTATSLKMGGSPILSGNVAITPTDSNGNVIPFVAGDGSQNGPQAFTAVIASGALASGFSVPDQALIGALTPNTPVFYSVRVTNTQTKQSYSFVLPPGTVTGPAFALDQYRPAQQAAALAGTLTTTVLPVNLACTGNARVVLYSGSTITAIYECVNGTLLPAPVGSGGGAAVPATSTTAGVVKLAPGQTSSTLSALATSGNWADVQNKPTLLTLPVVSQMNASGATTLSFSNTADIVYDITLTGSATFSFNPPSTTGTDRKLKLIIRPAGYQATLPASSANLVWSGGAPPGVSTSGITVILFSSTGTAPIFGGL